MPASGDISALLRMVERKADLRPATPSAFDRMILLIKSETGDDISLSTMKRVWGYIQSPHMPSNAILSILSRYVGFKDWEDYVENRGAGCADPESDFLFVDTVLVSAMQRGDLIRLEWGSGKWCLARLVQDNEYEVVDTANIKLRTGDRFKASSFSLGQPFSVSDVCRDGTVYPVYVGARRGGIKKISLSKA